jgi:hypothetical protein
LSSRIQIRFPAFSSPSVHHAAVLNSFYTLMVYADGPPGSAMRSSEDNADLPETEFCNKNLSSSGTGKIQLDNFRETL